MAAAFLSQAQSFLSRSTIWSHYTANPNERKVTVGVWTVTHATHNTNGKRVSIFEFEKSGGPKMRNSSRAGEACTKVLKSEASKLSRMRHPCMLEVVEPLEETRSSLIFATEQIQCGLRDAIHRSTSRQSFELDEVEQQKGLLQICKALQFLHDSGSVHGNLTPEAVVINAKGDWKLASLAFSRLYNSQTETPPPVDDYSDQDASLPLAIQIDLDYAAPELIIHHDQPAPASDMWSLGCIAHAMLQKSGDPPFSNRGKASNYRRNLDTLDRRRREWQEMGNEADDLLSALLQKSPGQRATSAGLPTSCSYFSSILVSTLRFLDRDTFFSKSVPEQVSFMKGLRSVLPRFSDRVRRNRILPGLLEQGLGKGMRREIVPSLLPNVFYICDGMKRDEFQANVLPSLKQLFLLQASDPPECALALLEYLPTLQQKCGPAIFKEEMTPLLLSLLSSPHAPLLIKTLQTVPSLCTSSDTANSSTLDAPTVKDVIFPKVAETFAKTTVLGVKVAGLVCLGGLITVLDKYTLTEKLVPMLAKIKTKEPSVLLSCLTIFSLLSSRLTDPIMISTLILPQLWTMSAAPLLDESQFHRFMNLIDNLTQTVKTERGKELRALSKATETQPVDTSNLSWEELVRGGSANGTGKTNGVRKNDMMSGSLTPDEVTSTGFITPNRISTEVDRSPSYQAKNKVVSLPTQRKTTLGARTIPNIFPPEPSSSMTTMAPSVASFSKPNYNISVPPTNAQPYVPDQPTWQAASASSFGESIANPWSTAASQPKVPQQPSWNLAAPPGFGSVLQPTKATHVTTQSSTGYGAFRDFDPLG